MDNVKHHSRPPGPDTTSCEPWISPIPCWPSLKGTTALGLNGQALGRVVLIKILSVLMLGSV